MAVLTTKLHIPSLRRNLVPRRRLLERLDEGLDRPLTLISAPAGFGKTTLLAEWLQTLQAGDPPPVKVAWLSLDGGDNDPARFSVYLAAALQGAGQGIAPPGSDSFALTGAQLHESHLIHLINQVAELPQPVVLILDDYHLITAQAIHDALAFLADHPPQNLHLVLASRADPPLPLARLRARGQLAELRQSDLRFTTQEAAAFLNQVMGLDLSAGDVAALEARTEGWIAGLHMAALSLQGHYPDPATRSAFVQAFTGSHRFVLDYLVEEVLEQQPPALQQFLLQTSILERLSGPLCDALLAAGDRNGSQQPDRLQAAGPSACDAQSVLEGLEAANLFIVPLDDERRWYRYHRLFADLLRRRLGQATPELAPALHRRASAWHEQQGLMAAAIDHALAAHDLERAAALMEESADVTLMRSEITTLLNWVRQLPDELVRSRPGLCSFHAWALLLSGGALDSIKGRLRDLACAQEDAERTGQAADLLAGSMAALRAYLRLFQGDTGRAADLSRQALERLPEDDRFPRNMAAWILSLTRLFEGDLQTSRQALQEIIRMSQQTGNPLVAVTALRYRAKLQMRQGRLRQAQELLERALQLATDPQGQRLPIASEALIGLGELKQEWNDLDAAADCLTESIELARQWSELSSFDAYGPLARVRLAQGDLEAAGAAIETARRIAAGSEITGIDDLVADLQEAHSALRQGDVEGAMRWAERRGLVPGVSPQLRPDLDEDQDLVAAHLAKYEQLVLARLFIRQGRAAEALDLLAPLLVEAERRGRIDLTIEIQILRALACQAESQDAQALDALAEALTLAEPGGWQRIFLDEGAPLARLLRAAASRGIAPAYTAHLLAAFAREPAAATAEPAPAHAQPLIEPLSQRELEVLRLLATGMTNPEIADALTVAASTVHSHCKSLYGKLDVHRRWEAVERGQELGLI